MVFMPNNEANILKNSSPIWNFNKSDFCTNNIQLVRERLSEKVHATIRKVLWVVFSSLFFKQISKNGKRGHGSMLASAKGKQQKKVRQLHYLSGLSREQFLRQPF